jgi:uncharacterized protein YjaG (DUF416 family)
VAFRKIAANGESVAHCFEPVTLERKLYALPSWGCLAFGALLLDRALPNFLRFAAETGAPGGAMLRGAQAKVWGLLEGNNAAAPYFGITAKTCEVFSPETEQHTSLYTSSALDAVGIVCNLLDYIDSHQAKLLVDSASLRRDSVDIFLQRALRMDVSAPDFETQLLAHRLMQEELGFQQADLEFLTMLVPNGQRSWSSVLERSITLGYTNMRMTLQSAQQ